MKMKVLRYLGPLQLEVKDGYLGLTGRRLQPRKQQNWSDKYVPEQTVFRCTER